MDYQWWVFVHLVGVFAFLIVHGVSVAVGIRLRKERDPVRVNALLDFSGRTVMPLYVSMLVLLAGGVVAAFVSPAHLWSFGWIWAALGTLVVVTFAMYGMARPYYQRVRFITRAVAEGSKAVTPEQYDSVLMARRPLTIMGIGFVGLAFILYLMVQKPTLGLAWKPPAPPSAAPTGTVVNIAATNSAFAPASLIAPAGEAFSISFRNNDSGLPHNVSIYTDSSASKALFKGALFAGPASVVYRVKALPAATYFFRCDVHPTMTGSLTAKAS